MGTGFLHKSGDLITAAHVVKGCDNPIILLHDNTQLPAKVIARDEDADLALIIPSKAITATPLAIAQTDMMQLGWIVAAWGYPGGYAGVEPMISVGYLSGIDGVPGPISHRITPQLVVNAAFNLGNSGGPLVETESGEVIGVVDSKFAPISPLAKQALEVLKIQTSGLQYTAQKADGTPANLSEGQVTALVLEELKMQVQLVLGRAVPAASLRAFLSAHQIDP